MSNKTILDLASDLIVALRTCGFHISGPLLKRDADTGKLVGGWAGDELENFILKERNKLKP